MIDLDFTFTGELWAWESTTTWYFISLPKEMSEDIKAFTRHMTRGFRSVRVGVTIGESEWNTSIFPSKEQGVYLLPVKAAIRKAEKLGVGVSADVKLSVMI